MPPLSLWPPLQSPSRLSPPLEHAYEARHVSNVTLADFPSTSANTFFPAPGNDDWAAAFDAAFATNVSATFNDGSYDFTQFKAYFAAVKATLESKHTGFNHHFTSLVVSSAQGGWTGGYGIVTGINAGTSVGRRCTASCVVREIDGQLKITEVRALFLSPT